MVGSKGAVFQASSFPAGTTSVCPAKANRGPPFPRVAQKLSTSPNFSGCISNPIFLVVQSLLTDSLYHQA